MSGQQHAPAALYPRERLGTHCTEWAPGTVWTGGKSRPRRDSNPDRPVRGQLLYRLSYLAHTYAIWCSLLLLGYKPIQHVTVLNTVGNCNIVVRIIIL